MRLDMSEQSNLSGSSTIEKSFLLSGDDAVACAAIDAGVRFASGYPGTPATDILEFIERRADPTLVPAVWSINEKVAYESALAYAISGQRAIVVMKHVGLNVASDAFINSCLGGVNSGLVLVVADDPESHSSQNKQDSRWYRGLASTLLLEPSTSQEAYSMTRDAFGLSEQFQIPVIVRLTTRTAYGCSRVERTTIDAPAHEFTWPKQPERFLIVPSVSRQRSQALQARQAAFEETIALSQFTTISNASLDSRVETGIVCTGVGAALASEFAPVGAGILKVAGEPFPEKVLANFVLAHDEIVVLEEGDPILERRVLSYGRPVHGRLSGALKAVGELQPAEVKAILQSQPPPAFKPPVLELPVRLPEICKPCGYNKVFAALKRLPGLATPSDIGCNTLGGLPPYSVMDGIWSMGSSIGVACGLASAKHPRVLAIIGDSTFFHSGIPPLIEAVHQAYTLTVLLLDNGTTAMTGGQNVVHRTIAGSIQESIDLVQLIRVLGVQRCTPFDPHKLGVDGISELVEATFAEPGVKVLLYRSQCGLYSPGYFTEPPYSLEKETSLCLTPSAC